MFNRHFFDTLKDPYIFHNKIPSETQHIEKYEKMKKKATPFTQTRLSPFQAEVLLVLRPPGQPSTQL
jgi:hypothetical protein